jgi:type I restriction enzyme S subunit
MSERWKEIPFKQLATLQRGADLPVQSRRSGPYPVLASNGPVGSHDTAFTSGPGVVTGRSGTIGKPTFIDCPYWPLNTVLWVSDFHGNNPRFVFYFFQFFDFVNYATGTSVPTLNRNFVHSVLVRVPPLREQENIAALLFKVQQAMEIEEKLIGTARELKQSVTRQLFTRGLRGEPQKETAIGPIPVSWQIIPAEQVFKLTSGSKRPDDLSPNPTDDKPYAVLGGNGVMGYSSKWFVDSNECLVIGRVGEYCGAVHLVRGKVWITDNALYAKEWLSDSVRVDYLADFLRYYDLNRFKRAAGQPLVTQGIINEHSFPVPAPEEQRELARVLKALDRKIDVHDRKHARLRELFKALLHELMTGEIRVADLNIDTSEVAVH